MVGRSGADFHSLVPVFMVAYYCLKKLQRVGGVPEWVSRVLTATR